MKEWARRQPILSVPHLVLFGFLAFAVLAGMWVTDQNSKRNCAAQVYSLRVILQEIHPEPGADSSLVATIEKLNTSYARQYARIYRFIDGDRCVDWLPDRAPPPPTVPKH